MSLSQFRILAKLGSGAYSSVYKVERLLDNEIYALKKVNLSGLSEKEKQNSLNEIRILASIRHPHIIGYREAFLDETTKSLWYALHQVSIIMEFANNGDLYQKILQKSEKNEYFSEQEIWSYFIQIVKALKVLHMKNILHRDLKSANVFLTKEGLVKLGDMNVSKISQKGLCQTQTGTPYYASPEVWKDQPYGPKSDIWSLGCVIYQMMALRPPFQSEDMQGLYKKVTKGEYTKLPIRYSSDLNDLIRLLLQTDPFKRPTCQKMMSMRIVQKRLNLNQHDVHYQNPEFLETIRMPKDINVLTEHLPKPNYFSPKRQQMKMIGGNKTEKILSKINVLPRVIKREHLPNKSLLIKNNSIIEVARLEVSNQVIHRQRRSKKQKTDNSMPMITIQKKQTINMEEKISEIQKIYRQQKKPNQKK